ncbi:MAG: hypothetical protein EOP06_05240 [Proteobacteria bacterium]|nr:MAG: hypothetical protein EOP06_05240 [Pseudomonadota bacterium]
MDKNLLLLDVMNLAYRAYFALSKSAFKTDAGRPIFMALGFVQYIDQLVTRFKPDYVIAASDSKGESFRHKLWPHYKSQRTASPDDLYQQLPDVFECLKALGIPNLHIEATEADDILASVVAQTPESFKIVIVSSDKDLAQLIRPNVYQAKPDGGEFKIYGDAEIFTRYGIYAHQMVDYLSITGDKSDNIPGVAGLGDKGAAKLLTEWGSLEKIYLNIESITGSTKLKLETGRDMALLSKRLITLDRALPIDLSHITIFDPNSFQQPQAQEFFRAMELRSYIKR